MEEEAWQEFQASAIRTDREEQDSQEQGLGMGIDISLFHIPSPGSTSPLI